MHIIRREKHIVFILVIYCVYEIESINILYDTIVCFGDSLSDIGNVYNLTDSKWPSLPYYQGRFSNGPVWIEKLGISNLINYAYGSATSDNNLVEGRTIFNIIVPVVRQQIMMYKNKTNLKKINFEEIIYIIWIGSNDYYFNRNISSSIVINSTINGIKDLIEIGGKNIVILNQIPF